MKHLTITQGNHGDSWYWVGRSSLGFDARQLGEIEGFRSANPGRGESEQAPQSIDYPSILPSPAFTTESEEKMKLKITKRSGDSRTWVGRQPHNRFTKKQREEINRFRAQAHAELGPEAIVTDYGDYYAVDGVRLGSRNCTLKRVDGRVVLPEAAQNYVHVIEGLEDEIIEFEAKLAGLKDELAAAVASRKLMKRTAALDSVMTEVSKDSPMELLPSQLIAIREAILRQLN